MNEKMAAVLRAQFPPEQIGKLPRSGIQLDYVGHADVTSRLLEADPEWTWEPAATDEAGLPLFDHDANGKPVGLWIRLTVGGVTRLGYGSCPATQGDAVKVLIGDALRNAAMRFGVAVDLWAKGDRADPTTDNPSGPAGQAAPRQARKTTQAAPAADDLSVARAQMIQRSREVGLGSDPQTLGQLFEAEMGKPVPDATLDDIKTFVGNMAAIAAKQRGDAPEAGAA